MDTKTRGSGVGEKFAPKANLDQRVRSFVIDGSSNKNRLSVIVEARVDLDSSKGRRRSFFGASSKPTSKNYYSASTSQMAAVGKLLQKFELVDPPVRIKIADAYVAELSADEIRTLAEDPSVRAIRENRTHYLPGNANGGRKALRFASAKPNSPKATG